MSDRQDSGIRIHVYGYLCIPERSRTQPGFNQVQSGMAHIHMYTRATLWAPPDRSRALVVREYTCLLSPTSSTKFAFTAAVITALPVRLTCLYIMYITFNTL